VGQQIAALNIKGIYQRKEYKRQYPEGEAGAHVVGFTNVEDKGQEGMELAFNKQLAGTCRLAPRHQGPPGPRGRGVGEQVPPVDGGHAAVHRQQGAVLCLPEAARRGAGAQGQGRQRGGARCHHRRVLALANYPSYVPDKRQNLTGEQLRNRALTDTFEPGSTMKPFHHWLALEAGRVTPRHVIDTAPGRITSPAPPFRTRTTTAC
jgi:cell division protein FtsI (penicillin-binding protein 3)